MGKIFSIAGFTFREAIRKKVLILVLLAAIVILASPFFPVASQADRLKIVEIWSLGSISFFGILMAIFLAATNIPRDTEFKTIYSVVTKPVGKFQFLLGKIVGFSMTTGLFLLILGALSFIVIVSVDAGVPKQKNVETLVANTPAYYEQINMAPVSEEMMRIFTADTYVNSSPPYMKYKMLFSNIPSDQRRLELRFKLDLYKPLSQFQKYDGNAVLYVHMVNPSQKEITAEIEVPNYSDGNLTKLVFQTNTDKGPLIDEKGHILIEISGRSEDYYIGLEEQNIGLFLSTQQGFSPDYVKVLPSDEQRVMLARPSRFKVGLLFQNVVLNKEKIGFKGKFDLFPASGVEYDEYGRPEPVDLIITAINPDNTSMRDQYIFKEFDETKDAYCEFNKDVLSEDGHILVNIAASGDNFYISFTPDNVAILANSNPFWLNYIKSLFMIFLSFVLIITFAIMASTFLSGPVSITFSLFVFFCGSIFEQLRAITQLLSEKNVGFLGMANRLIFEGTFMYRVSTYANNFFRHLLNGIMTIFPDFQVFSTTQNIVENVNIPAGNILRFTGDGSGSILEAFSAFASSGIGMFIVYGLGAFILAYIVFKFKELGR